MTQDQFNKLPLLLHAREVCVVLGCTKHTLRELRQAYPDLAVRLKAMKHWRYRKVIVARLAQISYQ